MSAQILESQLLEQVDFILGPTGLVVKGAEGKTLSYNPQQHEYARLAAKGFCRRDVVGQRASLNILQAATGTGKTLGYLVPLMLYAAHTNDRVGISTFTRHLQRQVQADFLVADKWIYEVTGRKLTVACRMGRQNYISAVAIARLIDAMEESNNETAISFLDALQKWVEATNEKGDRINSGILVDYMDTNGLDELPEGIRASALALTPEDDDGEMAHYKADVLLSHKADILIVNHALMILNALRWGGLLDSGRDLSIVVFDEADQLRTAAEAALNADLAVHRAKAICNKMAEQLKEDNFSKAVDALYDAILSQKPAGNMLSLHGDSMAAKIVRSGFNAALSALRPVAQQLARQGRQKELDVSDEGSLVVRAEFLDMVGDFEQMSKALSSPNENVALISWSPVRAYPSLRLGQADPGQLLARLWNLVRWEDEENSLHPPSSYLKSALFTSATLGVPGRPLPQAFAEFMNSVGIFRLPRRGETRPLHFVQEDLFRSFEPEKFGSMQFVLADPRIEDPILPQDEEAGRVASTSDAWLDYCAEMIRGAHARGGRTLVLTGSFSDTLRLKERLSSLPGLLAHEQGHALSSLLPAFKRQNQSTLISPSGWEGLDLPGLLANVVITRIPNARPDSVELVLLRLTLQHQGYSEDKIEKLIRGRIFAESRRKLAQGLGRGIRQMTDNVTVWIADPRFPLPEPVSASLDSIVLEGKSRRNQQLLLQSIPTRFRRAFEQSKLWTIDGELYTPEL